MIESKILLQKTNSLFGREEVELILEIEKTPSENEVEKIIAEKFSSNSENIKIRQIKGKFGAHQFLVKADIYKTPELKNKFGIIKKRNRRKKGRASEKK